MKLLRLRSWSITQCAHNSSLVNKSLLASSWSLCTSGFVQNNYKHCKLLWYTYGICSISKQLFFFLKHSFMMLVRRHCGVNKGTCVLEEEIILIKYIDKRRFFGVGGQKKKKTYHSYMQTLLPERIQKLAIGSISQGANFTFDFTYKHVLYIYSTYLYVKSKVKYIYIYIYIYI